MTEPEPWIILPTVVYLAFGPSSLKYQVKASYFLQHLINFDVLIFTFKNPFKKSPVALFLV